MSVGEIRDSGQHASPRGDGPQIVGLRGVLPFTRGIGERIEHGIVSGAEEDLLPAAYDREDLLLVRNAEERVLLVHADTEERRRFSGRDQHGLVVVRDHGIDEVRRRRVEEPRAPVRLDQLSQYVPIRFSFGPILKML